MLVSEYKNVAYLQIGQIDAMFGVVLFTKEQVPQAARLCLFLEIFHDGDDRRPSFLEWVFGDLGVV